jgi:hypothetical protein
MCECALCTFPDKATAAHELQRVLRPGGHIGITDVIADTARLPAELTGLTAWIACVADARPLDEYAEILAGAGLRVRHTERHDQAMARMIDQIEARLAIVRMTARQRAEALGVDFTKAPAMARRHKARAGRRRTRLRATHRQQAHGAGLSPAKWMKAYERGTHKQFLRSGLGGESPRRCMSGGSLFSPCMRVID